MNDFKKLLRDVEKFINDEYANEGLYDFLMENFDAYNFDVQNFINIYIDKDDFIENIIIDIKEMI